MAQTLMLKTPTYGRHFFMHQEIQQMVGYCFWPELRSNDAKRKYTIC